MQSKQFKENMFTLFLIFFAVFPFIFLIPNILFYFILSRIFRRRFLESWKRDVVITQFIFIFLIYPTNLKNCIQLFNCVDIEGTMYLRRDLKMICWQSSHKWLVITVGIPIIIVWIIGYPIIVLI